MSRDITYANGEQSLNDTHDDGRAFQHQQELHRDSALNRATICVFDIERQALNRTAFKSARRMVWDDGTGMDEKTFREVFANINLSNTADVSPYLGPDPDPRRHSRKGHGGRATSVTFNGYGFPVITVQDGVGLMMWWFRRLNGKYALRDLPLFEGDVLLDGVTDFVVPPYVEPEFIDYDNDPDFAEVLISMGMEEGTDDDGSRVVRNPEAGLDWRKIPLQHAVVDSPAGKGKAIADDFIVVSDGNIDQVHYEKNGQPAHGTSKIMLGEHPSDDTAVTGDPFFRAEASPDDYASWLHQHLWEMPVETIVWNLFPRTSTEKHTTFDLEVSDPHSGKTVTKTFATQHRRPLGVREHFFGPSNEYVEWQSKPIKIDAHGTTLTVTVLKETTLGLATGWSASSRKGFIGVLYNNEIYEVTATPSMYRSFGIGRDLKNRVIFVITPPISDERPATYQEGVFNNASRGEIQWSPGSTKVHRMYEDWAANYLFNEPPEIQAMKSAAAPKASVEDPEFRKRYSELFNKVAKAFRSVGSAAAAAKKKPRKTKPDWMRDPEAEKETALIEGRDSTPMTDEGWQGEPGGTPRKPLNCELCNPKNSPDILFHEAGCPNKKSHVDQPGGGTKGTLHKGLAAADGPFLGGPSKSMVRPKIQRTDKKKAPPSTEGEIDFDPPVLEPGVFEMDEMWFIFNWWPADKDPKAQTKAGHIGVNIDLATVKSWLGQVDAGTSPMRPVGVGNQYFVNEIEGYVLDSPEYEPDDVVDAVYEVYTDTACQAVIVAIAHRVNKMPWSEIDKKFLQPNALTASVLAQADMRQRVRNRISLLPRRGAATP